MEKLSGGLSGIAGEYYVAAELSRRGFMASITLRNTDSIDIHATRLGDKKMFAIQVKTQQITTKSWPLHKKAESLYKDNLFYVFVSLNGLLERPHFYIVPSKIVAERIRLSHQNWLNTPGKKGHIRNDTTMRKFEDREDEFLEKWDFIK